MSKPVEEDNNRDANEAILDKQREREQQEIARKKAVPGKLHAFTAKLNLMEHEEERRASKQQRIAALRRKLGLDKPYKKIVTVPSVLEKGSENIVETPFERAGREWVMVKLAREELLEDPLCAQKANFSGDLPDDFDGTDEGLILQNGKRIIALYEQQGNIAMAEKVAKYLNHVVEYQKTLGGLSQSHVPAQRMRETYHARGKDMPPSRRRTGSDKQFSSPAVEEAITQEQEPKESSEARARFLWDKLISLREELETVRISPMRTIPFLGDVPPHCNFTDQGLTIPQSEKIITLLDTKGQVDAATSVRNYLGLLERYNNLCLEAERENFAKRQAVTRSIGERDSGENPVKKALAQFLGNADFTPHEKETLLTDADLLRNMKRSNGDMLWALNETLDELREEMKDPKRKSEASRIGKLLLRLKNSIDHPLVGTKKTGPYVNREMIKAKALLKELPLSSAQKILLSRNERLSVNLQGTSGDLVQALERTLRQMERKLKEMGIEVKDNGDIGLWRRWMYGHHKTREYQEYKAVYDALHELASKE